MATGKSRQKTRKQALKSLSTLTGCLSCVTLINSRPPGVPSGVSQIQWNNCKCQIPNLPLEPESSFYFILWKMLALAGNAIFSAERKTYKKCYHLSSHTRLHHSWHSSCSGQWMFKLMLFPGFFSSPFCMNYEHLSLISEATSQSKVSLPQDNFTLTSTVSISHIWLSLQRRNSRIRSEVTH